MLKTMKYLPLLILLSLLTIAKPSSLLAQGSVKGRLIDSAAQRPLTLATLTVFKRADTSLIGFRLSDPSGNFRVPGLPLNIPCYILVSFIGYDVFRKDIEVRDNTPLDLGTISLRTSTRTLDEALVTAERPPIRVYKDTIEFNAASFRTLPDALVEDLLRKLPGVDVDRNGNIMVNGKTVNRILVDGKRFFGDDPKMATRNLPANSIDKVQVADDQEQVDRSTDGDMTKIGKVINLTLKKSIKKGWFGKAYAGGGTDNRYQAGGIANIYRDTLQLSLLAFSNNVNAGGFTVQDIMSMGGFSRSGINSMNISNNTGSQGFAVNGINFGGGQTGDNRSTGAGFNLNHTPNKNFNLYLQYFFGHNDNLLQTLSQNQQFINDTTVTALTVTNINKELFSHVGNIGLTWHPNSNTLISFSASGNYSSSHSDAGSLLNTQNSKLGPLNTGNGNLSTGQYIGGYSHELRITQKYKGRPGRTLNLTQTLQYQGNLQGLITLSNNIYNYPFPDTLLFDQLRRQTTPDLTATAILGFVDPLSKSWTLRFNASYQYLLNRYDAGIYDNDPVTGHYDLFRINLSNGYHRQQNIGFASALLAYTFKKLTITGGIGVSVQQIDNTFNKTTVPVNFSLLYLQPSLNISWKKYTLQYNEGVTAPDIAYLSPVPDSTNPFYIVHGNPSLEPNRRRTASINYFSVNPKNNLRESFFFRGNWIDHDVILARTVDNNGVQSVIPVNVDGTQQFGASASIGKDFRDRHFIFTFRINPSGNLRRQKLLVNGNTGTSNTFNAAPGLSFGFNWNDKVELNPDYAYIISSTNYNNAAFTGIRVHTHQLQTDLVIRAPGKWIWEAKLLYRYSSEVAAGEPKENLLLNAALAYPLLAHNKGQLKLNVFNLSNNNNNFTTYTSGNSITSQRANLLGRYLMLTFTYNLQNFRQDNSDKPGKQRLFQF
jgi:hypothetical protein